MWRILILFILLAASSHAANYTAASASRADVVTALGLASSGDSVTIPAGSATWTSSVTTTKSIQFLGSDGSIPSVATNATTIITTSSGVAAFDLTPAADSSLTRVAGFKFIPGSFSTRAVIVNGKNSAGSGTAVTQCRVDHNYFYRGGRALYLIGWVYGVADHNYFEDCNVAVAPQGDNNASWGRTIAAGTANAFFIETNTFVITSAGSAAFGGDLNETIYHQEGARSVTRYNTFDGTASGAYNCNWYDTHGNQTYLTDPASYSGIRGQPILEVYNNTMTSNRSYRLFNIRGGSVLMHDNTMTNTLGGSGGFNATEEEGWQTSFFSPLRTVWPANDQLNNSFFWNNTLNGSAVTSLTLNAGSDTTFIQEGRDYFMAAPASSGGIETFSGFAGGSDATPTGTSASTMSYAAGANAYYPYTPYTYPHPLVGGGTPTLSSASIPSAGTSISLVLSESCTTGAGGSGGVTISASGGASTATYSSGSGSTTYVYSLSRTIQIGETVTVSYTQPGNGIESTASQVDLATFSGSAVTNNSTYAPGGGGSGITGKVSLSGKARIN